MSFEVTSQSHNYLSFNGGKHLIELWTDHDILAHLPIISHIFSSTTIKSMLALNSPDTLSNEEKGDWSIVHAVAKAGFQAQSMCEILAHCLTNLFICQVNRANANDSTCKDNLNPKSLVRLKESLAVQEGNHLDPSVLYSPRSHELSENQDPSCSVCGRKCSTYSKSCHFSRHVSACLEKKDNMLPELPECYVSIQSAVPIS